MLTGVTWTVAVSVYAHGLTAWPGAARHADRYAHYQDHGAMPGSIPVAEQRPALLAAPNRTDEPSGLPSAGSEFLKPAEGPCHRAVERIAAEEAKADGHH
jgi:hypothetical protein